MFSSNNTESESKTASGSTQGEFFQTRTTLVVWKWSDNINPCKKERRIINTLHNKEDTHCQLITDLIMWHGKAFTYSDNN